MLTIKEQLKQLIGKIISDDEMTIMEVRKTMSELKDLLTLPENSNDDFCDSIGISGLEYLVIMAAIENILKYKKGVNKYFVRSLYNLQEILEKIYNNIQ